MRSIAVPAASPARTRTTCAATSTAMTHRAGNTAWATLANPVCCPVTFRYTVAAVRVHGTSRTQRGRRSSRASTMSSAENTAMPRSTPIGTVTASAPNEARAAAATARKLLANPISPSTAASAPVTATARRSPPVSGRARRACSPGAAATMAAVMTGPRRVRGTVPGGAPAGSARR